MNDLQIFKNEQFGEVRIEKSSDGRKKRFYVNGKEVDRFELLECALFTNNAREASEIFNLASFIFGSVGDTAFDALYEAAYTESIRKNRDNEFYYQYIFKKHVGTLISGAEITNVFTVNRNFPDAWVKLNDTNIPVEVKKDKFNACVLRQLQRYMDTYNAPSGIAVADSLTAVLPDNIRFISIKEIKALESEEKECVFDFSLIK